MAIRCLLGRPAGLHPWVPMSSPVTTAHSAACYFACASPTSRLLASVFRVWMLKFDASIFAGELPVGLGVVGIAVVLPGGNFVDEDLFVGNAAVEALGR